MRVDLPVPSSALAVGAHPDDIEFECGGTLAKWGAAGAAIHLLICTDGSKGTWDVDADTDILIARRQTEQREAARRIHPDAQVHFLGEVDGELANTVELRGRVARVIRETTPRHRARPRSLAPVAHASRPPQRRFPHRRRRRCRP